MIIKKETKYSRLMKAAKEDGINYIVGLTGCPIPVEFLKELAKIFKEESPENFINWNMDNWEKLYKEEVSKAIAIPYQGRNYLFPSIIIYDNSEKKIEMNKIKFFLKDEDFKLNDDVRTLTEELYDKIIKFYINNRNIKYANEQNLRLVKLRNNNDEIELIVQSVQFNDYLHSNLLLDAHPKGKNCTLREYIHISGKLDELNSSNLANHIGINILIFTSDGTLIMQKRSKKVSINRGLLGPSSSGALSFIDFPSGISECTLDNISKLRESFEELGIKRKDVSNLKFLGISRDLIRGGKPELFFSAETNLALMQLKENLKFARDRWESDELTFFHFGNLAFENIDDFNKLHAFFILIDNFVDKYFDNASLSLITNFAFWIKYRQINFLRSTCS